MAATYTPKPRAQSAAVPISRKLSTANLVAWFAVHGVTMGYALAAHLNANPDS